MNIRFQDPVLSQQKLPNPTAAILILLPLFPIAASAQTPAATVTAVSGPVDCASDWFFQTYGQDAPFCTAPNVLPFGSWAPYSSNTRRTSLTYTDHNFGGTVTTFAPFGNDGNAYIHAYMDPSPFSKTMKYMLVINQNTTQLDAIDGHTGADLGYNGLPYGNDQWFPFDPNDEESYYYIAGTAMYKHTINTNTNVQLHDFSADGFTTIHNRGRTIVAQSGWTAVYDDTAGIQKLCAINVSSFTGSSVTYYCASYNTPQTTQYVGIGSAAGVQLSRGVDSITGKQYVVLLMGPAVTIFSIDTVQGALNFEMRGPEADANFDSSYGNHNGICEPNELCLGNANDTYHGTTYQDGAGKQYWFAAMDLELPGGWRRVLMTMPFSAGNLMTTLEQNGGGAHMVMLLDEPNTFGDVHVSCANNADACVAEVGTDECNYDPSNPPTALATSSTGGCNMSTLPTWPHYQQIVALKSNMSSAVRLAYNYSTCFSNDSYWCQPRASISPDGSTVVFDSNWGVPNREYPNVVGTGTAFPASLPAAPALSSITLYPTAISAGASSTANFVYLNSAAPTGGALITLASSNPSAASVPATITIPAGASSAAFPVTTYPVASPVNAIIMAYAGSSSASASLAINPVQVSSITLSPTTIAGGLSSTANSVYLNAPAPAAGATVQLSSTNTAVAQVPASVTILAGSSSAPFSITTSPVISSTQVTIAATGGGVSQSLLLTVTPPQLTRFALSPTTLNGGTASTANSLYLSSNAPAAGFVVSLVSNNAAVQVPASVTIPAGASSASFSVATSAVVASTQVTITATGGGVSLSAPLTVNPAPVTVSSVHLSPGAIGGGGTTTNNSVTLASAAPAGGVIVSLVSSNPAAAQVPAFVTIPAGATTAQFAITTSPVASNVQVTITAVATGTSASATLLVKSKSLKNATLYPTTISGGLTASANWLYLDSATGPPGTAVLLSSSNTAVATVPSQVLIPAGSSSASFPITTAPVTASTTVTITATAGDGTKSLTLTVDPPQLSYFTLYPTTISGGLSSGVNFVYTSSAAPAGGITVNLTSSNPAVARVPATVVIPAGATSASFTIATTSVTTSTQVSITASAGGGTKSLTLTVDPPQLSYFTLYPTTISGGLSSGVNFVYTSSAAPAGGIAVNLTSSNPAVASVPATVTIPAGASSASFSVATTSVVSPTQVTITASAGGGTKSLALTVNPPSVAYMTLYPTSVTGGTVTTVNFVYLSSPAPAGGTVVSFSSSNPAVAQVPASITIPAGSSSTTFAVKTAAVTASTSVVITASGGGGQQKVSLTVTP